MVGFEIFGIILVNIAIIYSFYKKHDKMAISLIIALLALLILLGYIKV
ncbi:MAG: hypothetical protein AABX08_02525 [Nanoarchaeota archaeon]